MTDTSDTTVEPEATFHRGEEAWTESPAPRPVALVGMHRSGTSMVAKLLKHAGLNLGADDALMPPADENPEGFFEHLAFVRLNDEILNVAGAGWDCPPPAEFDWAVSDFDPFRERARSIAGELEAQIPWGWKDPRTTLTLPFWQSAIGPLATVGVVRNPLEVVTSLHRRNGFSIALSLTLWRIYMERLLHDTASGDRLLTHYDAFFLEPGREVARVLAFVGLDGDRDINALATAAAPGLRHHRKTLLDLVDAGFPSDIIALYQTLCREAEWVEDAADTAAYASAEQNPQTPNDADLTRGLGRVDLLRVENEALRRNNADFIKALSERELRIAEVESALRVHETARSELEGILRERDGRIYERNAIIHRRDHLIATMQKEQAAKDAELSSLRAKVESLSTRLLESERAREAAEIHERELRTMHTAIQEAQYQRDAEIMGTLGSVLSRHSPGAPASIYHRRLVDHIRRQVEATVPAGSRVLVATYGDQAMLDLGNQLTLGFPRSVPGVTADYTDISDEDAIVQLEELIEGGAQYLVVPSPALAWLANHPGLENNLTTRHSVVIVERGVVTIYALGREQGQTPA